MPKGGRREGAGRKTKAEELGLPKLIEEVIGDAGKKALIEKVHTQAIAGNFPQQQLMLAYIYGKPVEKHDIDQETKVSIVYADGIANLINPAT